MSVSFYALNRLTSVSESLRSIGWDPVSRLGTVTSGGTTLNYQYDGADLAVEYVGATFHRRHIFGPGLDEPVVTYESSGVASWPLADHLGSTTGFSDNAGALTAAAASRRKSGNGTVTICGRNQQVAPTGLLTMGTKHEHSGQGQ